MNKKLIIYGLILIAIFFCLQSVQAVQVRENRTIFLGKVLGVELKDTTKYKTSYTGRNHGRPL